MNVFFTYTVLGCVIGASYAIAASGLVLTYATTRIFNVAHGATAMVMAFTYWELAYSQGLPNWLALLLVVFVIAPAFGALLERYVIRRVADATTGVTLVVTLAAMAGRLTSLPKTFAGAAILGLLSAYASGYLPTSATWTGFREAIPAIFLLLMLLLMPQAQLRVGRLAGIPGVRTPELWKVGAA